LTRLPRAVWSNAMAASTATAHTPSRECRVAHSTRVEEARLARGEDRLAVIRLVDRTVAVIADGAGGVSGGAIAANAICRALDPQKASDSLDAAVGTSNWSDWLSRCDQKMAASGLGGLAAAVVVSISDDGTICGASVGDCEAWVFGQGAPLSLTDRQIRKPLLGEGDAHAVGFGTQLSGGTLVVASDGLWKYMAHERIAEIASMRPLELAAAMLVDGVRLRNGALQDDVAVMVCEVTWGR